ncbi:MAG: hypothetical protein E7496_02305 [Ruminococcus sp.]|nr:hypothetical protein [Ruminococcus sp.]
MWLISVESKKLRKENVPDWWTHDFSLCPVCGRYAFHQPETVNLCPVCGWKYHKIQMQDYLYIDKENPLNVNQARLEYFLLSDSLTHDQTALLRQKFRSSPEVYIEKLFVLLNSVDLYEFISRKRLSPEEIHRTGIYSDNIDLEGTPVTTSDHILFSGLFMFDMENGIVDYDEYLYGFRHGATLESYYNTTGTIDYYQEYFLEDSVFFFAFSPEKICTSACFNTYRKRHEQERSFFFGTERY